MQNVNNNKKIVAKKTTKFLLFFFKIIVDFCELFIYNISIIGARIVW